jgi:SH3 domain-containing YSC84-like protein 1
MNRTMRLAASVSLLALIVSLAGRPIHAKDAGKDEDRLKNAGVVLDEILQAPDSIPQSLLDKAKCVVIFPSVLKAAFGIGGSYGRGAMTCR